MAQIQERIILIRLSKLVKGGQTVEIGPEGIEAALESVVTELVGEDGIIVEVEAVPGDED